MELKKLEFEKNPLFNQKWDERALKNSWYVYIIFKNWIDIIIYMSI